MRDKPKRPASYLRARDAADRKVGSKAYVLGPNGAMHILENDPAVILWGALSSKSPTSVRALASLLRSRYAVKEEEAESDVIEFLARTINRNVRELVGGLNKLIAYAQLTGQPVSLQLAEEQLTDILSANRRRITIDEIQRMVCQFYRVDRTEMASKRRARAVVRPRQVAMYLAKVLTPRSYPEIGRKFGGRDHSTVIHAVRLIEELRTRDADMDGDVRTLLRQLED